jgi:hypothetical protein
MMNSKEYSAGNYLLAFAGIVASICVSLSGCAQSEADTAVARPDVITIDTMSKFGALERPVVLFLHDQHTIALTEQAKDCDTCHLQMEDSRQSQKFLRLVDEEKNAVMDVYHDECVACHNETAAAGSKSRPTICGDCHQRRSRFVSTRRPIGFDRSLHHRHVEGLGQECDRCHHEYNEETKEIFYAKGKETTCRYCHLTEETEDVSSLSQAAHWACVGCHSDLKPDAGPTDCAGCHDAERQAQIARVDEPKRLERGQPDFVLLRANEREIDSSKLNTVPFSHIGHEDFNSTCRVCHHESMTPCAECHTLGGSEKSQGVTLQRAMHAIDSEHSCVGCHDVHKKDVSCAGCHSLMEQGRLSEHACTICHAGPSPADVLATEGDYTSLDPFRPSPEDSRLSFTDEDIPETVTIGILSEKYEPAVFPHRQVVNKLLEHIGQSKIATYFHGHENVVCQGCHHNSPAGTKPPLCESCHGQPFNEAELFKPGLYGAYHRQCLGCHQAMQIEKPSDCVGCHALKTVAEGN